MNNSFNESLSTLLTSAGLPLFGLIAVFVLGVFLVMGYSMKFSLSAAGVGRFGFWKSSGIVFLTTIAMMVVNIIGAFTVSEKPALLLLTGIFSVLAYAMVVALVGRCGVGRGIKTYFYNGLFGTIGTVLFMIGFGGLAAVAVPMINIDQEALARLKENLPEQNERSADPFGNGLETGIESLTHVSFPGDTSATDVNDIVNGTTEEGPAGSMTRLSNQFTAPPNSSDEQVQDAFYEPSPKKNSATPRTDANGNTFEGVRENPFFK